nr:hypothetical protein [Tanacetum cinerariifolium]
MPIHMYVNSLYVVTVSVNMDIGVERDDVSGVSIPGVKGHTTNLVPGKGNFNSVSGITFAMNLNPPSRIQQDWM